MHRTFAHWAGPEMDTSRERERERKRERGRERERERERKREGESTGNDLELKEASRITEYWKDLKDKHTHSRTPALSLYPHF